MAMANQQNRRRGYTLLMTGMSLFAVMGMTALAVDLGRMYVARNEAQTHADAAALDAVLELDGTMAGLQRARNVAAAGVNRWDFASRTFQGTAVEFATAADGPWQQNPATASGYRYARIRSRADVPLTFIRLFVSDSTSRVGATAVAGQEYLFRIREGLFPFSPFAHNATAPNYGLVPGQHYTLRWASNPKLNGNNTCKGDRTQTMIDLAQAGGGDERGFIESTSASLIRQTILYDYQTVTRVIGESVVMTGGAKQTMRDALIERVNQDSDTAANSFAEYASRGLGNGRRLVAAPMNTGSPNYRIVQIGAFFLLRGSEYPSGGNKPFCAEFVGAYLQGSRYPGAGGPGYYVARLAF